jgi:putative MATE family efflux protein
MTTDVSRHETTTSPGGSLLQSIRGALAGAPHDYTTGSLSRAITLLAIPMVLEMAMESLFGILDVFWVGRLSPEAVATVGLTEAMLTLVFAVALGLSMSTTAMVARRIGEGDRDQAAVSAVQAIAVGVAFSVVAGALGAFYARPLLVLMGASPEVVAVGSGYATLMIGSNVTILLLFLINAAFRGAGDAMVAMRSLWLANAVNIVLDPCLIFGLGPFPEMGLLGAALGTTIGRAVGVLYQFRCLARGGGHLKVERRHLRLEPAVMVRLLRVSLGGIVQMLIVTASWVGLVRILTPFGSAALAGYTIAVRIIIVAILPAWGVANAAATLVGQNLGAGRPERAERSVWLTGFYNMAVLGVVTVLFLALAEPLIRVFSSDPEVVRVGVDCLRVVSAGYVIYAWGMVLVQAFNGAGDTTTPTYINLFCYWLFQIPVAFLLAQGLDLGPRGVFLAIPIAEAAMTIVSVLVFRRGRWKTRQV